MLLSILPASLFKEVNNVHRKYKQDILRSGSHKRRSQVLMKARGSYLIYHIFTSLLVSVIQLSPYWSTIFKRFVNLISSTTSFMLVLLSDSQILKSH